MSLRDADTVRATLRGMGRWLRQATGEAKWDEYVAACSTAGVPPVSRRAFERERADHREHQAAGRCC